MAGFIFTTVVLARLLVPLLIPRFPLPAILACLVIDAADQTIFQLVTDAPLLGYQTYDKALDNYYLAIAFISTMRNWRSPTAFQVARFLYFYRLVGVLLFELIHARWLLLVFPNTFEYFFIAYEAVRTRWNPLRLSRRAVYGMAATIWIVVKLPQEWWIHVAKLDFTEFTADHPWVWGVIGVAAAAAAVTAWRTADRWPRRDWRFTFDVDRHLEAIDLSPARERVLTWITLEKVVLISLMTVIFAQVLIGDSGDGPALPELEVGNLGIAIGVAVVVVSNAAVTQWWYGRGHTWSSTLGQFGGVLVINVVLLQLDALLGGRDGSTPRLVSLFYVLLLTLMITLFDRFRRSRPDHPEHPDRVSARTIATTG